MLGRFGLDTYLVKNNSTATSACSRRSDGIVGKCILIPSSNFEDTALRFRDSEVLRKEKEKIPFPSG